MNYNTMGRVITFGEIYFEASSVNLLKIQQSAYLGFSFKGSEMSVAASLCNMGIEVAHITAVSDDFIGEAAIASMMQYGIDTTYVKRSTQPLPITFIEHGIGIRRTKVASNYTGGAFTGLDPQSIDWSKILTGSSWLYWSLATPLRDNLFTIVRLGTEKAHISDINVVADLSITEPNVKFCDNDDYDFLLRSSNIYIAGVADINRQLGTSFNNDNEGFAVACAAFIKSYPNVTHIFDKVKTGTSVYARAWVNRTLKLSREIEIGSIIDEEGTPEAFSAALLYALRYYDENQALNFAIAAYALKHTVKGIHISSSIDDIVKVLQAG